MFGMPSELMGLIAELGKPGAVENMKAQIGAFVGAAHVLIAASRTLRKAVANVEAENAGDWDEFEAELIELFRATDAFAEQLGKLPPLPGTKP